MSEIDNSQTNHLVAKHEALHTAYAEVNKNAPVPHADLIRAVLDGKVLEARAVGKNLGQWWAYGYDYDLLDVIAALAKDLKKPDYEFRIKPEPKVQWCAVHPNGCVEQSYDTKDLAVGDFKGNFDGPLAGVLRLELDPDTLDVISAKTEQP